MSKIHKPATEKPKHLPGATGDHHGADAQRKLFPLVDATEPNLLEETFDYGLPPLIHFDGPVVEYVDGRPIEFDPQTLKTRELWSRTRRSATASRPGRRTPSSRWSRFTTCSAGWAGRAG